tara:strand:+ start:747 stop:1709 length:963 start_codon:yes stop_codon:yes gene_type:complete
MSTVQKDDKKITELIKQSGGDEHPGENVEYKMENDPLFKPISEEKKLKIDEAVEKKIKSLSLDETVDTDTTTVPGQNFALISIVAPKNSNQKHDSNCLKIKGVFDKLDEARKHAELLQKMDDTFDIFVVEMYKWLLVPPDPELLEQVHVDSKLNEILSGHREDQLKSKMYFEERKRELMENISIENQKRKEQNEEDLKNGVVDETPPDHTNTIKLEEILSEPTKNVEDSEKLDNTEIINVDEPEIEEFDSSNQKTVTDECNIKASNLESIQNQILGNCPNSAETSTPSELMEAMVNSNTLENPSTRWADQMEDENLTNLS